MATAVPAARVRMLGKGKREQKPYSPQSSNGMVLRRRRERDAWKME
jgi:hypothetical protein